MRGLAVDERPHASLPRGHRGRLLDQATVGVVRQRVDERRDQAGLVAEVIADAGLGLAGLAGRVGIPAAASRLKQYPHQLSGGLRQRVMIAMALMCSPALILADEPTTALDVTIQAQILHLLAELQRELHMGLVLITHDLGIVARIATRVVVMYAGEVVETGTAAAIFASPAHPYTRGLIACIPVPGKTKRGEPLGTIPGMVPSLIGTSLGCHFASRCSHAADVCRRADIPLQAAADGRLLRCVRHGEIAADPAPRQPEVVA